MIKRKTMDELGRQLSDAFGPDKHAIIVILDDVRSMHNVGSVFRTCDAFAVQALYLCGYTPQPPHRDIHKTALGATETVPWQHFTTIEEAVLSAKQLGFEIAAVEQAHDSTLLNAPCKKEKVALVFGNEVSGVSDAGMDLADHCIEIPQWGAKHSLNVAVSVGVVLWEMVRNAGVKDNL